MPRALAGSQSQSYLVNMGSPCPDTLPSTSPANNVSIRGSTTSTRKPHLKATSFSIPRVASAPVDAQTILGGRTYDSPPALPKRNPPKRFSSAFRAAERGKGELLPSVARPVAPPRGRSMSSGLIQQQQQQQQDSWKDPSTTTSTSQSFFSKTLRSRGKRSEGDHSSGGGMDTSAHHRHLELTRNTSRDYYYYSGSHDHKHRKSRGFRPPPNFLQMLAVILVTCLVWDSYRRSLSTMEQFDKLKHDESLLLLHLHKMEKTSIQLGEVLSRINDGSSSSQHQTNHARATDEEPVDAEITRITIAQLKQMEAELQNELGSLQTKLQADARRSIIKAFGEGPIQITLDLDLGDSERASVSIALAYDTPYAAWTLIDQVQQGRWVGSKLHWDKGLTISAIQDKADAKAQLDFVERSIEEHKPWTVGLTDTPGGGLTLFVNLKDNSLTRKNDVCVGKIVDNSFGALQQMVAATRRADSSDNLVTIRSAAASRMSRGKSFFE